jgi:hypothetical protein
MTGVVIPYEIGYATDFTNDILPRHYQIGGWYDTREYADPLNNADGTPAITLCPPPWPLRSIFPLRPENYPTRSEQ